MGKREEREETPGKTSGRAFRADEDLPVRRWAHAADRAGQSRMSIYCDGLAGPPLTTPAVTPAAAAPAMSSHAAGGTPQSMSTSVFWAAACVRLYGPSVQTTLPFLLTSSTR